MVYLKGSFLLHTDYPVVIPGEEVDMTLRGGTGKKNQLNLMNSRHHDTPGAPAISKRSTGLGSYPHRE